MEIAPEIHLLINLIILLIFLVILDKASHVTIKNATKTSEITGLGKTAMGFLLIAFSTSLPELSVAFTSALSGKVAISIGNVLGSNIANVCLVVGFVAVLLALKRSESISMNTSVAKDDLGSLYFGLFVASIIPLSLIYIIYASQVVGVVLLVIFVLYSFQMVRAGIQLEGTEKDTSNVPFREREKLRQYILLTFIGVIGVVASSYFIVEAASNMAETVGVPKVLIGATVIAFGTSLPEFATTMKAVAEEHSSLALGNIVGSCFINITLILGVTLAASPLQVNMAIFSDLVTFSLIANLFLWYFLTIGRISWREGAFLLFIYLVFLASTIGGIQPH
ncbi:MAG: sodium:calcium antiporter [Candidatus Bathyarchaeaceae archaeon]